MARLKVFANALLAIALLTTLAQGQLPGNQLKVTVPFEFKVAGRTLPAGDYFIRAGANGNFLQLHDVSANNTVPVLVGSSSSQTDSPKLVFTESSGKMFLTSVATGSVVYELPAPRGQGLVARVIEAGNSAKAGKQ
jgi:hypothetical protein